MSDLDALAPDDQLALAALLRLLVRLDGKFSEEEQGALEEIALAYGEKRFWQLMDEAGRKLSDESAIKQQASRVTDPTARQIIYGYILSVARSDTVQGREQGLLDWLESQWHVTAGGSAYRSA